MPEILPSEIASRAGWDGTSPNPHVSGGTYKNRESAMDWAEHQGIVFHALKLVVSSSLPDIFLELKHALEGTVVDGKKVTIYVTKGIHQPETNAHLTLETETKNPAVALSTPFIRRYHLNLHARPVADSTTSFRWVGVQFTCTDASNAVHSWPLVAPVAIRMKDPASNLTRRNSINTADLAAHVAAVADAKAAQVFNDKCLAFEALHAILPIDRAIRTAPVSGWVKPTYNGLPKPPNNKAIKFQYDGIRGELKLVA